MCTFLCENRSRGINNISTLLKLVITTTNPCLGMRCSPGGRSNHPGRLKYTLTVMNKYPQDDYGFSIKIKLNKFPTF